LLNVVVQQVFTFATGPSILTDDGEEGSKNKQDRLLPGPGGYSLIQDPEHVGLLDDVEGTNEDDEEATRMRHDGRAAVSAIVDMPDVHWPRRLLFMRGPVMKVVSFLNPPVVGGIIACVVGVRSGCVQLAIISLTSGM
jgi:hypothetical protein